MSEPATGIAPVQRSPLRWILLMLVLLLVIAFVVVPWININRYHRTIADSLSSSLGRPVHLASVQLEVLPHTGLAVTDFVVEENPGFGAEPILRAPSVLVTLRLSSLWGGHLEASRIDLDNASVNLVRDAQGQWNLNSLLIQAAHSSDVLAAPRPSAAHRLPYIEFRSARINFKTGADKRAFSFLNSDVSIWLDEPDRWRFRFEGQPARTDLDLDLADTGIVRLDGSLNRAAALDQMPLKIHAEWTKAPLGQVSRMLLGQDSGWRGLLSAEADLAGDIRNLQVSARLRIDDAHRQEFTPLKQLNIDARCRAIYHRAPRSPNPRSDPKSPDSRSIDDLTCLWPVGDGHLLLTGSIRTPLQPQPSLTLEINRTPAEFALSLLGLLRRGVTASLSADGLINGHFVYTSVASANTLSGQATVDSLALTFPGLEKPLAFPALHFTTPDLIAPSHGKRGAPKKSRPVPKSPTEMAILLTPAPLSLGAPDPVQLSGQFTAAGYQVRTAGKANLARLAALGRSSGLLGSSLADLTATDAAPQPPAVIDLTFAGPWMTPLNTGAPTTSDTTTTVGSLRIQHARVKLNWLPEPVDIASATAVFSPDTVTWSNAAITVNGIAAHGSYTRPLACTFPEECEPSEPEAQPQAPPELPIGRFNLDIPSLDPAALESALMGAGRHNEFLSAILAQVGRQTAPWPPLDGTIHIGSLNFENLVLRDTHGTLSVRGNRLGIASLGAAALGGTVNVTGGIEVTAGRPVYSLNLNWTGISAPQVAALFHEKWGAGTINGQASLALAGYTAADLVDSAHGTFQWDWTRGSIASAATLASNAAAPSASLEKASLSSTQTAKFSPVHFSHWHASGAIAGKTLKLDAPAPANPVTGTITFDRDIDLSWPAANDATLRIGGTLANPTLESAPPSAAP